MSESLDAGFIPPPQAISPRHWSEPQLDYFDHVSGKAHDFVGEGSEYAGESDEVKARLIGRFIDHYFWDGNSLPEDKV